MPFFLAFTRGGEYDTGIHIDHLNKIFDPFFTTRPDVEGTGLGLSTEAVLRELDKEAGHQFDPEVGQVARKLIGQGLFTLGAPTYA